MSIDKSKLRLDIIHSFGADFEDLLEKAQREIAKNDGAKIALKTAMEKVNAITAHVEADLEDGTLEGLISGDGAGVLPLSAYVKRKIMQAAGAVENLMGIVAINNQRSQGELTAYKRVFELTQKKFEAAKEKVDLLEKIESGEFEEDMLVARSPAEDIRARKAAAHAAKEAAKEEAETPAEESPKEAPAKSKEAPAKKPSKRRKKK